MLFFKTDKEKINKVFSKINSINYFNYNYNNLQLYLCNDKIMKSIVKKIPKSFSKFLDCGYISKNKDIVILFDVIEEFVFVKALNKLLEELNIPAKKNYLSYDIESIYNLKKLETLYNGLKMDYYDVKLIDNYTLCINNLKLIPEYYLRNNEENIPNLYKIEFNPEPINKIEIYFDNMFSLMQVKIYPGKEHPNVDKYNNYCIGEKKYKQLTLKLINSIIMDMKIYNLMSFHKIPNSMYKYL